MSGLLALYRSVVGKKVITGVTGGILMAFLLLHVAGNLKCSIVSVSILSYRTV